MLNIFLRLTNNDLKGLLKSLQLLRKYSKAKGVIKDGRVLRVGGGKLLVRILSACSTNEKMVVGCLRVCENLSGNLFHFFESFGGRAILDVINKNAFNLQISKLGVKSITALAKREVNASALLSDTYAVDTHLKTISTNFETDQNIQELIIKAIWTLCSSEEAKERMWERDMVQFLIKICKKYGDNAKIHEFGIHSIKQFDSPYAIVRMGALDCIQFSLDNFNSDQKVIRANLKLIRKLAVYITNVDKMIQLNIPSLILAAVTNTSKEKRIMFFALEAIYQMSDNTNCIAAFLKNGALGRLLIEAINRLEFKGNDASSTRALWTLKKLADSEQSVRQLLSMRVHAHLITTLDSLEGEENELHAKVIVEVLTQFNDNMLEARDVMSYSLKPVLEKLIKRYPKGDLCRLSKKLKALL